MAVIISLARALQLEESKRSHFYYGLVEQGLNRKDLAWLHFQLSLTLNLDYTPVRFELACLANEYGDRKLAIQHLNHVLIHSVDSNMRATV